MGRRYIKDTQYFLITFTPAAGGRHRIIRLVEAGSFGLACEKITEVEPGAKNFKNLTIGNVEGLKLK